MSAKVLSLLLGDCKGVYELRYARMIPRHPVLHEDTSAAGETFTWHRSKTEVINPFKKSQYFTFSVTLMAEQGHQQNCMNFPL